LGDPRIGGRDFGGDSDQDLSLGARCLNKDLDRGFVLLYSLFIALVPVPGQTAKTGTQYLVRRRRFELS